MKVRFLVPVTIPNPEYDAEASARAAKLHEWYPVKPKIEVNPGYIFDDVNDSARPILSYMLRVGWAEPLDEAAQRCTPPLTAEQKEEALRFHEKVRQGLSTGDPDLDADPDEETDNEEEGEMYVESLGDLEGTTLLGFDD